MNANQIINMVMRLVMRQVLRSGMNAGIKAVGSKMGRGKKAQSAQAEPPQDGSQSDGPDARAATKRAAQAIRAGRRIG
ncbi:MAG: hypothetical protein NXH74_12275 [Rhodobacteraceae bacterium]|jgi:hypothetical protein|nr:hypothetical protein [Paracoccaceae bacterium]